MGSHRIRKIAPLFLISVACMFVGSAFATPNFDIGPEDFVSGQIFFDITQSGHTRKGNVEYVVYRKGEYTGTLQATGSYSSNFVYAYRVNNTGELTDLSIDAFVISLIPESIVLDPLFEGLEGVEPSGIELTSTVDYKFANFIYPGNSSRILLFNSPNGPADSTVTVEGYYYSNLAGTVPVPTPEPVSFVLFGGGLLMLRSKRRSLRRS